MATKKKETKADAATVEDMLAFLEASGNTGVSEDVEQATQGSRKVNVRAETPETAGQVGTGFSGAKRRVNIRKPEVV